MACGRRGREVAIASGAPKQLDIVIINLASGTQRPLTTDHGRHSAPSWSPDGSRLAFSSRPAGENVIEVMPAAGGPRTALTPPSYNAFNPV